MPKCFANLSSALLRRFLFPSLCFRVGVPIPDGGRLLELSLKGDLVLHLEDHVEQPGRRQLSQLGPAKFAEVTAAS